MAVTPTYIVKLVEEGLKRGDGCVLDEYVSVQEIGYSGSVVAGLSFVVLTVLEQLGVYGAVTSSLPAQQAAAVLHIVLERAIASKPLPVMAQQRRFVAFFIPEPKGRRSNRSRRRGCISGDGIR